MTCTYPAQMKNAMQVKPAHGELQCKLFVGMIPHTCTASEIESIFLRFGEIVELNVLKRRSKISNKGCAFIQYKYKHQALRAIEELHGKHVIEVRTDCVSTLPHQINPTSNNEH